MFRISQSEQPNSESPHSHTQRIGWLARSVPEICILEPIEDLPNDPDGCSLVELNDFVLRHSLQPGRLHHTCFVEAGRWVSAGHRRHVIPTRLERVAKRGRAYRHPQIMPSINFILPTQYDRRMRTGGRSIGFVHIRADNRAKENHRRSPSALHSEALPVDLRRSAIRMNSADVNDSFSSAAHSASNASSSTGPVRLGRAGTAWPSTRALICSNVGTNVTAWVARSARIALASSETFLSCRSRAFSPLRS